MKKFIIAGALALGLAVCTDTPTAERILRQNGYTEIEMTGYQPFSCGKEDTYHTGFRAKAPGGGHVAGVVCSAWLIGVTIRFDCGKTTLGSPSRGSHDQSKLTDLESHGKVRPERGRRRVAGLHLGSHRRAAPGQARLPLLVPGPCNRRRDGSAGPLLHP